MIKFRMVFVGLLILMSVIALAAPRVLKCRVAEAVERIEQPVKKIPGRAVAVADVQVVPLVHGRITEVAFKSGASVNAGDLLYSIEPAVYQAKVRIAESRVAVLAVKAKNANRNYERRKSLVGRGVSEEEVERAMGERDSVAALLREAEASLDVAEAALSNCRICAPISGVVGTSAKSVGDYIGDAAPLVNIVQMSPVRVGFSLSNGEFLRMFEGRSQVACSNALVRLTLSDGTMFPEEGALEYVENSIDSKTDSVRMYAVFGNGDGVIRPGGVVSVTLSDKRLRKSVAVPVEAVRLDSKGMFVWVVGSGCGASATVKRRAIVCGRMDGGCRSVFSGVHAGERVVVDGVSSISEGDVIEVSEGGNFK